jgi:prevent-host-death family protein
MTLRAKPTRVREVGVRELSRRTGAVLESVAGGERVVIVRHGDPVAFVLSVDEALDVFLAHAAEFVRMRVRALRDLEDWE